RVSVPERLRHLPERGAVVLDRVPVDVEPRGEEPVAPRAERKRARRLHEQRPEQNGGVAAGGKLAGDQVTAGTGRLQSAGDSAAARETPSSTRRALQSSSSGSRVT